MLYGNVIFIKKSGGDGSKFPVTNTNICIGRSDDCIIRIQNPLISQKHCQLTIENDGQAIIKNLSSTNPTILNDQPLGNGKYALHQGDILKLGERLARWEYLPSSKYYPAARSSEPLAAVVTRCPNSSVKSVVETSETSGNSAKKRRKRFTETGRRSLGHSLKVTPGSAKALTSKKQLMSRHSLQLQKFDLSPQVKLRSSIFESSVSESPKGNYVIAKPGRKSQKWEVTSVSPPNKVNSAVKNRINRKSTPIKKPMTEITGEKLIKSGLKNASKAPNLLTIAELPLPNVQRILSERTVFDDVPENINLSISPKSPLKGNKTLNKVKINSQNKSSSKSNQKRSISKELKNHQCSFCGEENREIKKVSMKVLPSDGCNMKKLAVRNSVLQNENMDLDQVSAKDATSGKISGISVNKRKSTALLASNISSKRNSSDAEAENNTSLKLVKSSRVTSGRGKSSSYLKASPVSTPKKVDKVSRGKKSIPSGVLDTPVGKENVKDTPRKRAASSSKKQNDPQNRGVKRKLSALASAERAAKKLKSITPTKPDKNKKAALLLLGKASNKLKVSQKSNMVIKKIIVKKAIKQLRVNREKSGLKKVKKDKKSKYTKLMDSDVERSPDLSSKTSTTSTKRHSTPIGKTPVELPKKSSLRKSVISDNHRKSEIGTPSQRIRKSISSISSVSESDSMEVLPGSVLSKYSEKKSVSFSSTNSSIEYLSPNSLSDVRRPVSKRLRSQSAGYTPHEFTELSPFALGLTPKRMDDGLKSQKQRSQRSFSMTTPKNDSPTGIMKSASVSKINRKLVAFSDKDSNNSSYLNFTRDAMYDINDIQTPDVSVDLFVSPLSHKNSPKLRTQSSIFKNSQEDISLGKEEKCGSSKQSLRSVKLDVNSTRKRKSLRLANVMSANKNLRPPKSPKNDLTDVKGVRRLMESPGRRKSPKNDLTDVKGVRRLMESPGRRKSPKNDLTDVKGVRRLMESPGRRKSPKNDLTDVKGVRRLMESPGRRKSPKNDLTDVKGVRRLMESPGRRKSPKNDLTDVKGVRRLMESPGRRKSPKNDLTDVKGLRKLFEPLKQQKSPKNDLTDLRGVRKLMESLKQRKSPRNDLTDVTGVKQLLLVKSPKNDLSNVSGLDTFFKSPANEIQCLRTACNPASEDTQEDHNLPGVSKFGVDKVNNVNIDLTGVAELFTSPEEAKTTKRRTRNANATLTPLSIEGPVLRSDNKAASKIVQGPYVLRTRRQAYSFEASVDQSPRVTGRGKKTDTKDEIEKTVPKKKRTGSESSEKMIKEMAKLQENSLAEEVVTGRRTRALSKLVAESKAEKRPATPAKSATPVKRTRKNLVREKSEASSTKTAATSNSKEKVLTTPESKSRPVRITRKSTVSESLKINKTKRSKEVPAPTKSSRSLRQKETTKKVKEPVVSLVVTRRRKATAVSPLEKKLSKSSPVKTRGKAK